MDKPVSFDVNHSHLKSGVYVSREDNYNGTKVTTLDLRVFSRDDLQSGHSLLNIQPNWFDGSFSTYVAGLHSLEHLIATFLRTHSEDYFGKDFSLVYVGPGGCLSMFYLVVAHLTDAELNPSSIVESLFIDIVKFLEDLDTVIPATGVAQCGNPSLHSKAAALQIAKHYLYERPRWETVYPEAE